ncbi:transcription factor SRM1-like [Chenopodium quinoa]|uniref:transcription factor SRM1-like n=1 Tax=Chenopodium quinoa TaxID=63459 RepID=UPI000B78C043|nr:transcription factor SRM1-like [Chenopodium quinoa]
MPNLVSWTREEEKAFENAIATHSIDESNEEWDKVASMVPTKTIEEIKQHYEFLVEDVGAIEAGKVPLPSYGSEDTTTTTLSTSNTKDDHHPSFNKDQRGNSNQGNGYSPFGPSSMGNNTTKASSKLEQERKKGIPWTEEEHRLFLLGLDKFGKGDWRSISRNFVITRTPTQVASHAQKYFIRLNSMNRDRRRSSIHDITSVNGGGLSPNQTPITGQQNNTSAAPAVGTAALAANKHRPPPNVNMAPAGIGGMYGTQIGHPVTAAPLPHHHMASAVGTPVMLPPPGQPHHHHHHHPPPHYAVPVAYPLAPPPMHR